MNEEEEEEQGDLWDLMVYREEWGPQERCPPVSPGYRPQYVDTVRPMGSVTCCLTGLSLGSAGLGSDPGLTPTHLPSSGTRHGAGAGRPQSLPLPELAALPGQWGCDPAHEDCQGAALPLPACLSDPPQLTSWLMETGMPDFPAFLSLPLFSQSLEPKEELPFLFSLSSVQTLFCMLEAVSCISC